MTSKEMTIGKLAAATHCKPETIRYYEQVGLLPAPARSHAGYRLYSESHRRRLVFIRKGRDLGFSLGDIRAMLDLAEDQQSSCCEISRLSRQHLTNIQGKINMLTVLSVELNRLINRCSDEKVADCRIIEALLDEDSPVQSGSDKP
ncbi:MAG: helix-turn-helix domain-containing protein [Pseudomonadota bacterium]